MTHYTQFIPEAEAIYSGRKANSGNEGRDYAAYMDATKKAQEPTRVNTSSKTAEFMNSPAGKTTAGGLTGLVLGGLFTGGPIGAAAGAAAGIYLGARGMGEAVKDIGKAGSYLIDKGIGLADTALKYGSKAYIAKQVATARARRAQANENHSARSTTPAASKGEPIEYAYWETHGGREDNDEPIYTQNPTAQAKRPTISSKTGNGTAQPKPINQPTEGESDFAKTYAGMDYENEEKLKEFMLQQKSFFHDTDDLQLLKSIAPESARGHLEEATEKGVDVKKHPYLGKYGFHQRLIQDYLLAKETLTRMHVEKEDSKNASATHSLEIRLTPDSCQEPSETEKLKNFAGMNYEDQNEMRKLMFVNSSIFNDADSLPTLMQIAPDVARFTAERAKEAYGLKIEDAGNQYFAFQNDLVNTYLQLREERDTASEESSPEEIRPLNPRDTSYALLGITPGSERDAAVRHKELTELVEEIKANSTPKRIERFNRLVAEFNPMAGLIGQPQWNYWGAN